MVIVGLFSWWYTRGFLMEVRLAGDRLEALYDYFSIDLLLRTLFAPFRQISAMKVNGPLSVQISAFVDRLFSRTIGFVVRIIMIVIGSVTLFIASIVAIIRIVLWIVAPFLPIIGIILTLSGWVPWKV